MVPIAPGKPSLHRLAKEGGKYLGGSGVFQTDRPDGQIPANQPRPVEDFGTRSRDFTPKSRQKMVGRTLGRPGKHSGRMRGELGAADFPLLDRFFSLALILGPLGKEGAAGGPLA